MSSSRFSRLEAISLVDRMCRRMWKRGPDAAGIWSDGEGTCVLGHRRLSIIDLDSRSDQPMQSVAGQFVISFNGEIYNYRELKNELEQRGRKFRTGSDTEVILELVAEYGVDAVKRLRGMFALAVWDNGRRLLHLCRDPYGIKPLYYSSSADGVLFASQVKALMASGAVASTVDPAGLGGFFLWGSVPEPWTIYESVKAVPAGTIVTIEAGRIREAQRYSDVSDAWNASIEPSSVADLAEEVRLSVVDSVRSHLVSDVPVSVFLSGGLDSSVIAGVIADLKHPVEAITVGFEEFAGGAADEVPPARVIARHLGIPHTVRMVSASEFEEDLSLILEGMDQPSVDGVNTWFAAKSVAERGYKVALSGVGGDELFAGYSTFDVVPRIVALLRLLNVIPGSAAVMRPVLRLAAAILEKPKLEYLCSSSASATSAYFLSRAVFLPADLPSLMGSEMAKECLDRLGSPNTNKHNLQELRKDDWCGCVAALESTHYLRHQLLRDSDWASMAHSIELRTPLVDCVLTGRLAPYAGSFGHGVGKRLLSRSVTSGLPEGVLGRAKTGFSLPMARWLDRLDRGSHRPDKPWVRRWSRIVAAQYL